MKLIILLTLFSVLSQINCETTTCIACNKFSNFIWKVIQSAKTDNKLFNSIKSLCIDYDNHSDLSGFLEADIACNKSLSYFLDNYGDNLDKDRVCFHINACTYDSNYPIHLMVSDGFNGKPDCEFCIFFFNQLKELVTGKPTEMEFKVHFEDACHYLGNYANECTSLVDEYVDTLFDFIKNNLNPKQLCNSMKICPVTAGELNESVILPSASQLMNILPVNVTVSEETVPESVKETPECMICKKIVKIIQTQLDDNATEQEIISALEAACKLFPKKDQDRCDKVVREKAAELINILTHDIDPDTACMLGGMCVTSLFNDYLNGNILQAMSIGKNAFCIECELITHYIQNELYNYKNEKQIEEFVKNHVCDKLSFIMKQANCQAFIDQYGPMILQTIAQEVFNPDSLCYKELKLCKKTKVHVITPKNKEEKKCDICQKIIKNFYEINYSDLEVNTLVEKGCKHVSPNDQHDCTDMVKSFASHFLDSLDRYDNPRSICESVDICMTPGKVHLLGGHKCTYGPSYWCHSVSHANACNAFKYCHEKDLFSNNGNISIN